MPAGATYSTIATFTVSTPVSTYTFSSIPSTYTDLVLVVKGSLSGSDAVAVRFNGDATSNYGRTYMYGAGSGGYASGSIGSEAAIYFSVGTDQGQTILNIFNYTNTLKPKTVLLRNDYLSNATVATVALWKTSNAAISSISLPTASGNNYTSGTTFSLYGIAAA
jgi:hypothetical protein